MCSLTIFGLAAGHAFARHARGDAGRGELLLPHRGVVEQHRPLLPRPALQLARSKGALMKKFFKKTSTIPNSVRELFFFNSLSSDNYLLNLANPTQLYGNLAKKIQIVNEVDPDCEFPSLALHMVDLDWVGPSFEARATFVASSWKRFFLCVAPRKPSRKMC